MLRLGTVRTVLVSVARVLVSSVLLLLAASWVDTTRGPACLDGARLQAAIEQRVGARAHTEQVTLERLPTGDVRVLLKRGAALVASRELHVDEASCAAAERSIALLIAAWWKLPVAAPAPVAAPRPAPPPPAPEAPPPVAPAPEPEPPPEPAPPTPEPPPPAPVRPVVEVRSPPPAPVDDVPRWRWSIDASAALVFDRQAHFAGLVRARAGRRDGFGASLDLGIEGQRLDRDATGLVAVTPGFGTLAADWEHRFSWARLTAEAGVRLYVFAARSFGYDVNNETFTGSPALLARVALEVPLWRGLFAVVALSGGSRLRLERFVIVGASASVAVVPGFGQLTLGVGAGSK